MNDAGTLRGSRISGPLGVDSQMGMVQLRQVDGVRSTETFVYLRIVKQIYSWGTR